MNSAHDDIVISGVAAISAAGVGTAALIEALAAGNSKLQPVPEDVVGESGHLWGKADSFKASDYMSPLKARKFDRSSLMAVVAAGMALKDAAIDVAALDSSRIGIVLGCGFGGIAYAEEFLRGYFTAGTEGLVPMLFPNIVPNASASNASIEHKLKGPNVTLIQRFCSAESAFLMAMRFLEEDRADIMLTGGVDELFAGMLKGFKSIGQLNSFGGCFSEGAGLLVLERGGHARRRNARILAGVGEVRSIGRLSPGLEAEGVERLLGNSGRPGLMALSGTATSDGELLACLPEAPVLDTGRILGRALAMGGLSMTALALSLKPGQSGVQIAASPEGPYYAIEMTGGDPVSS
ncbi:beta-ketoacyl synthase N-terminal-like domain-containing protein [Geomonas sp.]|uniref:beta-ketoacyl synthase N-terminal-like domain-containing protein n=1 Tax=Geomonas sp. TaxID=2651584 RepID=UPI002B45C267|nr:beta-ketoacyl synthase N-terminal-like domain-containing protein [Geomonas sp.]HJV36275.1 beta-ketoacyl synthase N-terminal-like domain-containing protein [Geomonas sp.]